MSQNRVIIYLSIYLCLFIYLFIHFILIWLDSSSSTKYSSNVKAKYNNTFYDSILLTKNKQVKHSRLNQNQKFNIQNQLD